MAGGVLLRTIKFSQLLRVRAQLLDAILDDGYACLDEHGILQEIFSRLIVTSHRIFDPALEPRLLAEMHGAAFDGQRGYRPLNTEAYDGRAPEFKRMFSIGFFRGEHPLYGQPYPEWWPFDEEKSYHAAIIGFHHLRYVALTSLRAICDELQVPIEEFINLSRDDDSIFRFLEYPEVPESNVEILRAGDHHDSDYLTLTWATAPGLMIEKPGEDGVYEDGSVDEGRLVLTVGLAFERRVNALAERYPSIAYRLGGKRFQARRHKVVAVPGYREQRFAFAFFLWPHPDQEIEPGLSAARHLYREMSRHMQTAARDPGR